MMNESESQREWREATHDDSDEGSLDSDWSTEYESKDLTPRLKKRPRGEEEDDPDFNPLVKTQRSRAQPQLIAPDEDTKTPRLEVLASVHTLINTAFDVLKALVWFQ